MNSFTYCLNEKCSIRAQCKRSHGTDDPWQNNAYFAQLPGSTQCFGFIPNRQAQSRLRWQEKDA
jgi:hypothetical protein